MWHTIGNALDENYKFASGLIPIGGLDKEL
jgi:hypothetical protein